MILVYLKFSWKVYVTELTLTLSPVLLAQWLVFRQNLFHLVSLQDILVGDIFSRSWRTFMVLFYYNTLRSVAGGSLSYEDDCFIPVVTFIYGSMPLNDYPAAVHTNHLNQTLKLPWILVKQETLLSNGFVVIPNFLLKPASPSFTAV